MNIPTICTFESLNAPDGDRWLARFYQTQTVAKKARFQALPIIFNAPTEEQVIAKARAWWTAEVAKEEARKAAAVARTEKRRAA